MAKLTLADGTEYSAAWCSGDGGVLCAQLVDIDEDFLAIVTALSNAEATRRIVYDYHAGQDVYDDYTQLIFVQDQRWRGGGVLVQLRRNV